MSHNRELQSEQPEKKDWQVEKLGGLCEEIRPFLKELTHLQNKEQIKGHIEVAIKELETIRQLAELLSRHPSSEMESKGDSREKAMEELGTAHDDSLVALRKPIEQVATQTRAETEWKSMEYILKETPAIVYAASKTPPYGVTYISDNILSLTGYTPEEFVGDADFWAAHLHPEDAPRVFENLPKVFHEEALTLEYRFRFKDDTYHWMYDLLRLAHDEQGKAGGLVGSWLDITEKKNAEEQVVQLLRETQTLNEELRSSEEEGRQTLDKTLELNEKLAASEQFTKQIINNVNEAIVVYDKELRCIVWNVFAEKIFGIPAENVIGKTPFEIFPQVLEKDPERFHQLQRALAGETVTYPDYYVPFGETTGEWIAGAHSALKNSQGENIGIISTASIITQRKQAEEENIRLWKETKTLNEDLQQTLENTLELNRKLADSELFSRQIIDSVNGGIAVWDTEGHYVVWNAFLEKISGKSEKELLGRHPIEAFPELFERDMSPYYMFRRALTGETVPFPDFYAEIGETKNWYTGTYFPFKNSQGEIIGVLSTTNVITERKLAEKALLHQKNLLQAFYDTAHFYMCVFELKEDDFIYLLPNRYMASFWGLSVEEMAGKTAKELQFLPPEAISYWFDLFKTCIETGKVTQLEYAFTQPDGAVEWHFASFSSIGDGHSISFISSNITDRKRAEEENIRLLKESQTLNEELRASEEEVRQTLEKTLELNEKLAASEEFTRQIISSANEAIAVYDSELRFVVWNTFAEKTFGIPAEKIIGKNPREVFPHVFDKEPDRYHQMQRALAGEVVTYKDLYVPFSETSGEWFTGVHSPFKNSQGEIIGVISMGSVITERKRAEQTVLHQKNLLQAFYDSSRFSMCVFELTENDFIYQLPNQALAEYCGISVGQLTGKTARELKLLPPEVISYWSDLFRTCIKTGKTKSLEYSLPHPDDRVEWHFGSFSPIAANTIAFISIEITERKRAEEENERLLKETQALNEELQASESKLQEAQKIARLGNWELKAGTQKMEWSEEVFRIFGLDSSSEVPDFESCLQLIDPEFREKFRQAVTDSIELGKGYEIEVKILSADVPFRWTSGMGRPVFNAAGDVVKLIGIWYDITDRKIAEEQIRELLRLSQEMNGHLLAGEEELRQSLETTLELNERILESEQRWQFALEGSEAGVWDWNMRTDRVFYSKRFKELMGYEEDEEIDSLSDWLSKIHPEDKDAVLTAIDEHRKGETESYLAEYRSQGKENEYDWLLGRGKVIEKDKKGNPVRMIGTITNITERKQYEKVLADWANYLNKIINTLIDPVFVKDRQHRWVLVNDALCNFHHLTREQLIGKTDYDFFPKEEADIFCQQDDFVFTTGEDDIHEEKLTHQDGRTYTLLTKKSLYTDSSGEPFIVGIFVDITERKQIEEKLKQQNEDLRKINAELDSFVYRTSHDLRAPLVSILGLINISRLEEDHSKKAAYLNMMEKSITRLDTFISDIINYSRNSRLQIIRGEINFHHMIQETLEGLKFLEGSGSIEKKLRINQTVPFFSDVFRIKIICNNLISNAIKYRSPLTADPYILIHIEVTEEKAVMEFKDNGVGIPKENIDKIFDMFYRASSSATGSGLGLYIVKEVVHTLKGSIGVQSQLGKGTTFTIEIPNLIS